MCAMIYSNCSSAEQIIIRVKGAARATIGWLRAIVPHMKHAGSAGETHRGTMGGGSDACVHNQWTEAQ